MKKAVLFSFVLVILLLLSFLVLQQCKFAESGIRQADLERSFMSPPDSVRPGVYWYFMDGNLSKDAMTSDLESMKDAGIGHVIFLEVNVGLPRGKVDFLSESWQDLFKHAVRECERLGVRLTLGIGPGWTGSGGPWVKPEQSMLILVSSETLVTGPAACNIVLPVPQQIKPYFGVESIPGKFREVWEDYYEDVVVLAFPTPNYDKRITNIDEKALYFRAPFSSVEGVKPFLPFPSEFTGWTSESVIESGKIIDITKLLRPGGHISWDVPAGNWTIMRFGKRNNGSVTRPAPEPGLGFECDKFDTAALDAHFGNFVIKLLNKVDPRQKNSRGGWTMLHMDSWEMSSQNWTGLFREEFLRRRGYDLLPFLPVYTGRVVESPEISERFLWDVRLTAQELVIENHAKRVKELGSRYGLGLSIEPYDMNPCSDLSLGAVADVPMCEFWSKGYGFNTVFSCFEAASLAHIRGLPVVGAESFTALPEEGWKQFPGSMKNQGDWAFCTGINHFVYHTFAHKPYGDSLKPGMTMGPYGVHWDRGQTWWPLVRDYHTYISRCSFMLQQGMNVADILYLVPEGAPQVFLPPASALCGNDTIPDHRSYNFDACSPEMLIAKAEVIDHKVVFPGGSSYQVLVLPSVKVMTPELLSKIGELVENGAIVIGAPPLKSPSLVNFPGCDKKVAELVRKIWGDNPTASPVDYGKGRIYHGGIFAVKKENQLYPEYEATVSVIREIGVVEDFASEAELRFIHRSDKNLDIFFVSNKSGLQVKADCYFRIYKGKPELWDPITGRVRSLPEYNWVKDQTIIPMIFEPFESFFIVFDQVEESGMTSVKEKTNFPGYSVISELNSSWTVHFDSLMGGPGNVIFEKLTDWSRNPDKRIMYYSGIARYETEFSLPVDSVLSDDIHLYLDLEEVYNMAHVKLNGKDLGTLWTNPWRVDITQSVKKKGNQLEIEVANLWPNRLIGDSFMPWDGQENNQWPEWLLNGIPRTSGRYTFTPFNSYKNDSPLFKSGLTGRIKILKSKI